MPTAVATGYLSNDVFYTAQHLMQASHRLSRRPPQEYAGRVVTEDMWAARASRFPVDTPRTKEYYLLRSIFEEHYPSASALHTVPKVGARANTRRVGARSNWMHMRT